MYNFLHSSRFASSQQIELGYTWLGLKPVDIDSDPFGLKSVQNFKAIFQDFLFRFSSYNLYIIEALAMYYAAT